MSNQKARKSRPAQAASKGFSLNAHWAAIIVGLISMVGVLTASAIGNWDKLRGGQNTQAVAPDATGDLLAYNKQRRGLVESAHDNALDYLREAEARTTGKKAEAVRETIATIEGNKEEVSRQYDKMFDAIKDKKQLQADIYKTGVSTAAASSQRSYDALRAYSRRLGDDPREDFQPCARKMNYHNAQRTHLYPSARRINLYSRVITTKGFIVQIEPEESFEKTEPEGPFDLRMINDLLCREKAASPELPITSPLLPNITFPMGSAPKTFSILLATDGAKDRDPEELLQPITSELISHP